jgi:WD40 repeat protein
VPNARPPAPPRTPFPRRHSPHSLAVGCAGGICLWAVKFASLPLALPPSLHAVATAGTRHRAHTQAEDDPSALARGGSAAGGATAPAVTGAHLARFLPHALGCPASSISWSPFGGQLASASRGSAALCVWDTATGEYDKLWFRSGGGCAGVSWAPGAGGYVCAVGVAGPVRIWETASWRWETLRFERARAYASALWSGDGTTLLLLPARGGAVHYLLLRHSPPVLKHIDGGVHLLPFSSDSEAGAAAGGRGGGGGGFVFQRQGGGQPQAALQQGPQPALLVRLKGEGLAGGHAGGHADGGHADGSRSRVDLALAALVRALQSADSGAAAGCVSVQPLHETPSRFFAVLRFVDRRSRARAAALLSAMDGRAAALFGLGAGDGASEDEEGRRIAGWETVAATVEVHLRCAVWDASTECLAVSSQEVSRALVLPVLGLPVLRLPVSCLCLRSLRSACSLRIDGQTLASTLCDRSTLLGGRRGTIPYHTKKFACVPQAHADTGSQTRRRMCADHHPPISPLPFPRPLAHKQELTTEPDAGSTSGGASASSASRDSGGDAAAAAGHAVPLTIRGRRSVHVFQTRLQPVGLLAPLTLPSALPESLRQLYRLMPQADAPRAPAISERRLPRKRLPAACSPSSLAGAATDCARELWRYAALRGERARARKP